jgi:DNA-damage-inducible protein J
MAKTAQIRARAETETKERAEAILAELGLTPSAAINLFYRQIIMRRALPFPVDVPNQETRAAIEEARSGDDLIEGESLRDLLSKLLTRTERTVDLAELLGSDRTFLVRYEADDRQTLMLKPRGTARFRKDLKACLGADLATLIPTSWVVSSRVVGNAMCSPTCS